MIHDIPYLEYVIFGLFILIYGAWVYWIKEKLSIRSYNKEKISTLIPSIFIISIGFYSNSEIIWALVIALIIFMISYMQKQLDFWDNQEDILLQIYNDVDSLMSKDGNINYFRSCLLKYGYPHHNISELNLNYYLTTLTHKINAIPTLELKNKLKKVNDKIAMLNDYRRTPDFWTNMMEHTKSEYGMYGFLQKMLDKLETSLKEIKEMIKKDYSYLDSSWKENN